MAHSTPHDVRPPDTAMVFAATLRRRRRGEPWADDAVSTIRNPDHDTIRTQQVAPPDSRPVVSFALTGELVRWVEIRNDKRPKALAYAVLSSRLWTSGYGAPYAARHAIA